MKGLRLRRGLSFEGLTKKLAQAQIPFNESSSCRRDGAYFRYSQIHISKERINNSRVIEALGKPDHGRIESGFWNYYGQYQILKDFDLTSFHGNITFKNGLLVECTQVVMF